MEPRYANLQVSTTTRFEAVFENRDRCARTCAIQTPKFRENSLKKVFTAEVGLDSDLAILFGVETKALNRAVKRNKERFPKDFMFQLSATEFKRLRCQIGTSNKQRGGRRYAPFAFTEHGVVMAANVLNSRRAIMASVQVVRAFVRLRQLLATHADLKCKLEELEKKYDRQFAAVFEAIRELMEPIVNPDKGLIGFQRSR